MQPRISIVMGVYNAEAYLHQAIDSLLSQTFSNFELIAVNDGSTDSSAAILHDYAQREQRVRIVESVTNRGHAASLNLGIAVSAGDYIARMDTDDICMPDRFEEQIAFMDAHPEIGVCGSWVELFGDRAGIVRKFPLKDPAIRTRMLFHNPFSHPAVLIRKDILTRHGLMYPEKFKCSEDYWLWVNLSPYTCFANIPQVLVKYRLHTEQISSQKRDLQRQEASEIRRLLLDKLHIPRTADEIMMYDALEYSQSRPNRDLISSAEQWLKGLIQANHQYAIYPIDLLWNEVSDFWTLLCNRSPSSSWLFWKVLRSPLDYGHSKYISPRIAQYLKQLVKNLVFRTQ